MSAGIPYIPNPPRDKGNILQWCGEVWKYLRKTRLVAGRGIRITPTGDCLVVSSDGGTSGDSSSDYPFKIHATVEPELGVEIIVTISNGSIDFKTPLFKGELGDPISDSPSPNYTFAPSAGVYLVYLVVTLDKNGFLADDQDVWIEVSEVVNDPLPDNDAPVPDDMPEPGDAGTSGVVHIQLGYITVAVVEDVITVSTWNDIRNNFTFWYCDGEYTINPIS